MITTLISIILKETADRLLWRGAIESAIWWGKKNHQQEEEEESK